MAIASPGAMAAENLHFDNPLERARPTLEHALTLATDNDCHLSLSGGYQCERDPSPILVELGGLPEVGVVTYWE